MIMIKRNIYEKKEMIAPCDGMVFYVEVKKKSEVGNEKDEYIFIYLVSIFDEYNDFVKWLVGK